MDHAETNNMLGAYALHACQAAEAISIEHHLQTCALCAVEVACFEEVAGWLGVGESQLPPASLRSRVLAVAHQESASIST